MHFEGTITLKAARQKVWSFLMDPNAISKCFPDVQSLEVLTPENFKAKVKVGISFMKQIFDFNFTISDKSEPSHAKLKAHGSGGGSVVDFETSFDLTDAPNGGTTLKWSAEASVGGLVAGVGSRLIGGAAEKTINQLFECVKVQVEK